MCRDQQFKRWRQLLLGLGLLVIVASPFHCAAPVFAAGGVGAKDLEQLGLEIEQLRQKNEIPGLALALVAKDSIIWLGTFGLADLATGAPVTERTHFRVGSCTKSFVGLGFLKLVEEGRIDLDTPVSELAPEIFIDNPWQDSHPVRVIHLLEHTAGFDDSHLNWFYFTGPVLSLREALEAKADLRHVRWPPGTRVSYSSPGFNVAGYILGQVAGQRYEDYLKDAIFDPLGMKTTTIGRADENRQLLATGHSQGGEPVPYWYDYDEPAGALNCSIQEMALFVQCLLNWGRAHGVQVIDSALIARIGKPVSSLAARAGLKSGYSFGISYSVEDSLVWYTHGGIVPGFFADYAYNYDCGVGYVVLINKFDFVVHDEFMELARKYLECEVTPTVAPAVSIAQDQLLEYCGYYEARSPRMQPGAFMEILQGGKTVFLENDTLYEQEFMSQPTALVPVAQNLFRRADEPQASRVFTKTDTGQSVYATRGAYHEKTAGWKPILYRILVFGALIVMISSIVYAVFWIPLLLYKKIRHRGAMPPYLKMRIIPLLAVLSLVAGIMAVVLANQTLLEFGQKTPANVIFYLSTLIFAGLSTWSMLTAYRSFLKPVQKTAQIYAAVLSTACFGMTLYLWYWGIIGLKTWAY